MHDREDAGARLSAVVVGLLLIVVGVIFLAVQSFGLELPFNLSRVGWPLYIIAPGVVLLLVGMFLPAAPGVGLTIAGGIVTTVGLVLAYQSTYDHYASWAYAWALVAPTSVGAAMVIWSVLHGRGDIFRGGFASLTVGLILFLVGFAFFEGVLNIGGERGIAPLGRQALPIALIAAGVLVIVTRLWPGSRRSWATGTWQGEWRRYPPEPGDYQAPSRPLEEPSVTPTPAPSSDQPRGEANRSTTFDPSSPTSDRPPAP